MRPPPSTLPPSPSRSTLPVCPCTSPTRSPPSTLGFATGWRPPVPNPASPWPPGGSLSRPVTHVAPHRSRTVSRRPGVPSPQVRHVTPPRAPRSSASARRSHSLAPGRGRRLALARRSARHPPKPGCLACCSFGRAGRYESVRHDRVMPRAYRPTRGSRGAVRWVLLCALHSRPAVGGLSLRVLGAASPVWRPPDCRLQAASPPFGASPPRPSTRRSSSAIPLPPRPADGSTCAASSRLHSPHCGLGNAVAFPR